MLGHRRRNPSRAVLSALVCAALAWSAAAIAQEADPTIKGAARQIGYEGVQAYQAGKYADADEKLERAYSLVKVPTFGLWSARALVKLNRLVEASERYLEVTRITLPADARDVQKNAQKDAETERQALLPRVPKLTIALRNAPPNPELTIDGTKVAPGLVGVPMPVNPGNHTIEGHAGQQSAKATASLSEGQSDTVALDFAATPAAAGPPSSNEPAAAATPSEPDRRGGSGPSPVAFVALGVGAAGLVVGGITGVLALSKHSQLTDSGQCNATECLPAAHDDVDALNRMRTISTVGFIVGGVGIATGITVWVVTSKSHSKSTGSAQAWIGPTSTGIRAVFQ